MCQVAVTLTCAAPTGHALIGRALYLPEGWAADEERRDLAGVPDDVMFATKPQLADGLLQDAHDRGIRAAFIAGDEVYGGLDLRKSIRQRGTGYVLAVRSNYAVTVPSGRRLTVKNAASLVKPGMWQRMRTGQATKGAKDYHWAMIEVTPDDTPAGHHDGNSVLLLRRHRYTGAGAISPDNPDGSALDLGETFAQLELAQGIGPDFDKINGSGPWLCTSNANSELGIYLHVGGTIGGWEQCNFTH